jgi:NAD(P)-dependent dehydrogenase (short-subunit alcohol dehydrogenase family)
MIDCAEKTALLTGGASGIGQAQNLRPRAEGVLTSLRALGLMD